ncbi:LamG-like jellyroll fold domain-containing protein [Clostridium sp. C105KSO13]|uniref:LamG-like jellyroll fold domain-containing protein n=1 Tax=Clostridium sp. C105KSO13 TaxID=1776045 RepID=UPI0007408093|nr:LamG-like jellyroll fold domain-containing protein [Clostridium sp. C105KSO13]CUX27388.1 hypothetical protein BN3456_00978 [Clostridium sp. C105KSO13]
MGSKNLMPGILAGIVVLTSVFSSSSAFAAPENGNIMLETVSVDMPKTTDGLTKGLTAAYSFEDTLDNNLAENDAVSPIVKGLAGYDGEIHYRDGISGGKAIQLDGYGLKLNKENLGQNFTVSMWVKSNSTIEANQNVIFLGYHNPEKWFSVAGADDGSGICKVWANGNGYAWGGIGKVSIDEGEWHCLTLSGTEDDMLAYMDGQLAASGISNNPLDGEQQDIYVGITNWDSAFEGLVDEVKVYNRALSAGEIYRLYDDSSTPEEILENEGITVTESLTLLQGRETAVQVSMSAVVSEADPDISFVSSDPSVASVDGDGKVTAIGDGNADITTSVTLGNTTKTAVTKVQVTGTFEGSLKGEYTFEDNVKNNVDGANAQAIVRGLGNYAGNIQYGEGRDGGRAVYLDGYGLKLNQQNLGENYTVSFWAKPDGTLEANQSVLFLGYHNPEKWLAVSGSDGTDTCKIWTLGGQYDKHTTLFSPAIGSDRWYQMTLTGTKGKMTAYLDGMKLGTKDSNNPLSGEKQDIYLGVNNWDKEFTGLVDDVKIYNQAMTEEEVQNQARETFETNFRDKVNNGITEQTILGKNECLENIKYDLELMNEFSGIKVVWESSDSAIISPDGKVTNPGQDTSVVLKAILSSGILSADKEFYLNVTGLVRTELDALIKKAEAINPRYCLDTSKNRLLSTIKEAKAANSYTAMDKAFFGR